MRTRLLVYIGLLLTKLVNTVPVGSTNRNLFPDGTAPSNPASDIVLTSPAALGNEPQVQTNDLDPLYDGNGPFLPWFPNCFESIRGTVLCCNSGYSGYFAYGCKYYYFSKTSCSRTDFLFCCNRLDYLLGVNCRRSYAPV